LEGFRVSDATVALMPDERPSEAPEDTDAAGDLTWPALLAAWADFARAAVALPPGAENDRWRAAVPAIIELQSCACALRDLHRLPEARRPGAIEAADALVTRRSVELRERWDGEPPESVTELILDAVDAVAAARGRR